MIESLFVILTVLFILFGLLELSRLFTGKEILAHATARTARARTVGFNDWMCTKVMRTATIPTAGKMTAPQETALLPAALTTAIESKTPGELWDWSLTALPHTSRGDLETARIPAYLESEHSNRAINILNYEGWDDLSFHLSPIESRDTISATITQKMPLDPFVSALYDWIGVISPTHNRGEVILQSQYEIENHAKLYIDDQGY